MKYGNVSEVNIVTTMELDTLEEKINDMLSNGWILLDLFPGNTVNVYHKAILGKPKLDFMRSVPDDLDYMQSIPYDIDRDTKRMMELSDLARTETSHFQETYDRRYTSNDLTTRDDYVGLSGYKNIDLLRSIMEELELIGLSLSPKSILKVTRLAIAEDIRVAIDLDQCNKVNTALIKLLRIKGNEWHLIGAYEQLIVYLEEVVSE